MEAPDYSISQIRDLERHIERFVPKLFYNYDYSFKNGITIYVPKSYIDIINKHLNKYIITTRFRVLDIESREYS